MPPVAYTTGLHEIAAGTYAYLQPNGSWGKSNSGLLTSAGSAVLVDTFFTLGLTERLLRGVEERLPGLTITTVVNTHANGDHCWGNQLLPHARIIASAATAAEMPQEITPQALTAMVSATPPDSPLGRYTRAFFADYDFGGIELALPTETFTGETSLDLAGREIRLIEVGPAHSAGDVIVHVPDTGVIFAGDILFIGDHPIMWAGPIGNWVAACDRILATGAQVVVPGHGPVTDPAGVVRFRDYLRYVGREASRAYESGIPYHVAAAELPLDEYADWGHPERLVLTYAAVYRNLGWADPDDRLVLIQRMAEHYQRLQAGSGTSAGAPATASAAAPGSG